MIYVRRLFLWVWRSWPVIVVGVLVTIHVAVVNYYLCNIASINKSISLLLQICGGLLILYSIDSNIWVIKKNNLFGLFVKYIKEFPLKIKPSTSNVHVPANAQNSVSIDKKVILNHKNIDEKLKCLQNEVNELKNVIERQRKYLSDKIDKIHRDLNNSVAETNVGLLEIKSQVAEVSIGGIKVQLFGVLLMVYGSIVGYIS